MTIGLSSSALQRDIESQLAAGPDQLDREQAQMIAQAIAAAIEKNNQEIDRELGRRFAEIERRIGR